MRRIKSVYSSDQTEELRKLDQEIHETFDRIRIEYAGVKEQTA
jgi:hypothetical protein